MPKFISDWPVVWRWAGTSNGYEKDVTHTEISPFFSPSEGSLLSVEAATLTVKFHQNVDFLCHWKQMIYSPLCFHQLESKGKQRFVRFVYVWPHCEALFWHSFNKYLDHFFYKQWSLTPGMLSRRQSSRKHTATHLLNDGKSLLPK